MLGQVGGAVAVQGALAAIGPGEAQASQPFALVRSERARGLKILVPGSGIAGMTAACEPGKLEIHPPAADPRP